jgi:hypothetical protein
MSSIQKNFILSYVFLVILPVLALLGILKYGRQHLTAPLAVGGTWKLESSLLSGGSSGCSSVFGSLQDGSLVISQSGKNLELTLPAGLRQEATGLIEGGMITASFLPIDIGSSRESCGLGGPISLTAIVDSTSTPRSFSGTLSISGCDSCAAATVHAVREEKSEEKTRR